MGRALPQILALLLGVATALAVGCGDRSNLIRADDASALKAQLAAVQAAVDAGKCAAAQAAIDRASARYQALPPTVDSRLRKRIGDGIRALRQTAPKDCQNAQTTTTTTTTETAPTVSTETTPPPTVSTETTPPPTVSTETTPPPTTTETTPATTDTTSNGGVGVTTP